MNVEIKLYCALCFLIVSYCVLARGMTNKTILNQLYILLKQVIHIIANLPYSAHSASKCLKSKLIPVNYVCQFRLSLSYESSLARKFLPVLPFHGASNE